MSNRFGLYTSTMVVEDQSHALPHGTSYISYERGVWRRMNEQTQNIVRTFFMDVIQQLEGFTDFKCRRRYWGEDEYITLCGRGNLRRGTMALFHLQVSTGQVFDRHLTQVVANLRL